MDSAHNIEDDENKTYEALLYRVALRVMARDSYRTKSEIVHNIKQETAYMDIPQPAMLEIIAKIERDILPELK